MSERTHAALPRLGIQDALRDAIAVQVVRKPSKAMPYTLAAELLREYMPAAGIPKWADLVARSGWDE